VKKHINFFGLRRKDTTGMAASAHGDMRSMQQ